MDREWAIAQLLELEDRAKAYLASVTTAYGSSLRATQERTASLARLHEAAGVGKRILERVDRDLALALDQANDARQMAAIAARGRALI